MWCASHRLPPSLKLVRVHLPHRKKKWPVGVSSYRVREIFIMEMFNTMRRNITPSPAWLCDIECFRVSLCIFHISFGETVFHLDLEIELIYNILFILSHTSLPRKPNTSLTNHNYLSQFIKCPCTVRQIFLPLYSVSRTYGNDNDRCYFNTAHRPGCQCHFFVRKEYYWLLTRD